MLGLSCDVACRRGQGLGSVLEERGPFDLMLIMAGTKDLATGVAPGMVLHSIQALHAECQMGGVRTVALRVPQSFFTFEDLSFGALSDDVKSKSLGFSRPGLRSIGLRGRAAPGRMVDFWPIRVGPIPLRTMFGGPKIFERLGPISTKANSIGIP